MFAKHTFNRVRVRARNVRLSLPVTRCRKPLVAAWQRDPRSGRLHLKWQPDGGEPLASEPALEVAA